ncbi:ATP-NAD kinase-like domain-containing protein [Lasiosphaeria miniovina]|uniref:ATP-NAD kinase-like domain-containing protein n=1 Tax=Lasiosphaeria miniovina TaxID=1954250 RepID=A0AA40AL61_9PEZI|nr:ATP-NAD kinase-like domain-containing protein [Lasiosphaeria miniovina]KAK0717886.1 ATP-NAD kinase-like domain-containing protein [Lasiosphaeria miniovina]
MEHDVLELSPAVILSLGKDALFISGQPVGKPCRTCGVGVMEATSAAPSTIDYYNILWAEIAEDHRHVSIDFASQVRSHCLGVRNVKLAIPVLRPEESIRVIRQSITPWIERLLDRSYGSAARRKRAWVVVNPHAGPGKADVIWDTEVRPIFEAARMPMTVVQTTYSGEAVNLAKDLNIDDYDIAIPCSGDGLPHEVFNGLGKRQDARHALSKIAVCHIPCGSGNAMSCNLYGTHHPTLAALAIVKGVPTPLDLVSVTQGDRRTLSFLSQALGMIADLDITTEPLRWMGAARFTYGFLVLAMQRRIYPCDIAVKVEIEHKEGVKAHYRHQITQGATGVGGPGRQGQASPPTPALTEGNGDIGLPQLKYGTVMDKLPDGWELIPYEKLGNFYCGNMAYMAPDTNFFSAALASDGLLDLITVDGDISLFKSIGMQLSVESGHFFDNPLVTYRKVSAYRIIPRPKSRRGYISIDGESIPWEPFQAEVHQGLGLTLSRNGVFEAPGPLEWDKVTNTERLRA